VIQLPVTTMWITSVRMRVNSSLKEKLFMTLQRFFLYAGLISNKLNCSIYILTFPMSHMRRIEITKKNISPVWLKIIGILIFMATLYKIFAQSFLEVNLFVYLAFNTVAIAIWTGKEIVVIDLENNVIAEGFRILGVTYLDRTKFSGVEKLFINRVNSSEIFRHLTRTINIRHENYKAFLKTKEGVKICVGVDTDKENLIGKLKGYNLVLKTNIFDNTLQEPILIN
jgi:hypothetical protein